jgi:hypothetical protein
MIPDRLALPASSHRRVLIALVTFTLSLMAVAAAPVAAGSGSLPISTGQVSDSFETTDGGTTWVVLGLPGYCRSGTGAASTLSFNLEFPLTGLPTGATITGATLALRSSSTQGFALHAIYGYAGDGSITALDAAVSGSPVTFTPTTTASREDHDVTSLMTAAMVTAGWAGFAVRQEPPEAATFTSWDCINTALYPILTIEYATSSYDFSGFYAPVANPDTFNVVKAGAGVALKFSLGGDQGLDIFAAGSPAVRFFPCASPPGNGIPVATSTAGGSTLSYAPLTDTYTYNWKTQKSWRGMCGELQMSLDDGTTHSALFKFK